MRSGRRSFPGSLNLQVRRRPGKAPNLGPKSSGVPAYPFLRNQPRAVGGKVVAETYFLCPSAFLWP